MCVPWRELRAGAPDCARRRVHPKLLSVCCSILAVAPLESNIGITYKEQTVSSVRSGKGRENCFQKNVSANKFGAPCRFVRANWASTQIIAMLVGLLGNNKQHYSYTTVSTYPLDTAQVLLNTFCACFGLFGIEIATFQRKQLNAQVN